MLFVTLPSPLLLFHIVPTSPARYPALVQLLLQPCDLLQALRIANQSLDALPLLVRKFDPIGFICGCSIVECRRRGRNIKGARFDADDLRTENRESK